MSIRNLLFSSVSAMILAGTANAGMNFLPDLGESGLGVKGKPSIEGDDGRDVSLKGCEKDYQTTVCTGSTPFETKRVRAENGQYCYQCRAFEANDCQKDDFYPMSVWNTQKPTASLNLPKTSLFAEVFGNIFGFRNAAAMNQAQIDHIEQNQAMDRVDLDGGGGGGSSGGGGGGSGGGTTIVERPINDTIINNGPILIDPDVNPPSPNVTIEQCKVTRKVVDKDIGGNLYNFRVTDTCKYSKDYVKGVWEASCDTTVYKYDSSNCSKILAGNKCGGKWDGCYSCSELYTISNAGTCKMPLKGVYEKDQTKDGSRDIAVESCSKTPEGCLYSCLIWLQPIACDFTSYPYTSSSCSGTLSGSSCTTTAGIKRYAGCTIANCTATTHPYTTDNCSNPTGLSCKDTAAGISRYKTCSCTPGYSQIKPSYCSGSIVTDKAGCYCCNERNGAACIIESIR